jgi:hypothetical protein
MVPAVVKKKRLPGVIAGCLLGLGWPAAASAHPEVSPQLVNRYVSVIGLGDRLEYFVTLLYGPLPAVDERKRLDENGDGKIAAEELERGTARWRARAAELATVSLDGQSIPLTEAKAAVQLGAEQGVAGAPLVVEIYGSRPLTPGPHQVRLEPGWDPPRLGETELSIDLSPDWELASSREGHGPESQARIFRFEGPRPSSSADRSATFTLRPRPAPPQRRGLVHLAAAIAALAGIALALEIRRRQRRT